MYTVQTICFARGIFYNLQEFDRWNGITFSSPRAILIWKSHGFGWKWNWFLLSKSVSNTTQCQLSSNFVWRIYFVRRNVDHANQCHLHNHVGMPEVWIIPWLAIYDWTVDLEHVSRWRMAPVWIKCEATKAKRGLIYTLDSQCASHMQALPLGTCNWRPCR